MTCPTARRLLLLLSAAALLSGCVAAGARTAPPPGASMSAGMTMPDGSVMGTRPAPAAGPPAVALMVCGPEIRSDIARILTLPAAPAASSTWVGGLYTCTYRLPAGPLVISVQSSPDPASATSYYQAQRARLGRTDDLAGLTGAAFGTPTGAVVLVKDNNTLTVDATGLPAQFGAQHQKRTDLAYEIASDILGCWTGD